jgi:hypothetical protein
MTRVVAFGIDAGADVGVGAGTREAWTRKLLLLQA